MRRAGPAVAVVMALLVLVSAFLVYRIEEGDARRRAVRELELVLDLKHGLLHYWRQERLGDGAVLQANPWLRDAVEHAVRRPADAEVFRKLRGWFASFATYHQYDRLFVLDPAGGILLAEPDPAAVPDPVLERASQEVLRSRRVTLVDFYRDREAAAPRLALLVPLTGDSPESDPAGVVVLRVDPEYAVYPAVTAWVGAPGQVDTHLFRIEADEAVLLSPAGGDREGARWLSDLHGATARAVSGEPGVLEGPNDRGNPAIGIVRRLPDSPWYLVAHYEKAELARSMFRHFGLLSAGVGVFLFAAGAVIGLAWRDQRFRHMQRLEALLGRLQAQAAEMRHLVGTSPAVIYTLRSNGTGMTPTNVSENITRMAGYTPEEALRPGWWEEHLVPDDRDAALARLAKLEAVDELTHEYRFQTRDGRTLWIRDQLRVTRRRDGRPAEATGAWTDVTDRKVAERRTERMSALYATLSQCNEAIVRCQSPGELFPAVCEAAVGHGGFVLAWIGLVDETTGRVRPVVSRGAGTEYVDGIQITTSADDPHGRGPTGTCIRENHPVWLEDFLNQESVAPWRERARQYGWHSVAALPLLQGGRPVGAINLYGHSPEPFDREGRALLVEMATDIGFALDNFRREELRTAAEARLHESEARYRTMFEENYLPALLMDPDTGRIHDANRAAARFYGWPLEVLRQRALTDLDALPEEAVQATMQAVRQTGGGVFEFRHRTADKGIRDVEVFSALVTLDDRPMILSLITDVTEKNLLQQQLLQAQKMEVVGRLAGGIAHDFNNLLTIINGTCDLALRTPAVVDCCHQDFAEIRDAGERAARLTQQLLAFSRKQVVAPCVVSMSGRVTDATGTLRRLVGEDVELLVAARDAGNDGIYVDPGQFDQVLMNLVVNARDAMPEGGRIRVETQRVDLDATAVSTLPGLAPGPYVELLVADAGTGMTPEVRARIFEPFFTTKGIGKGTGLGLATVYGIVRGSGGCIAVESEVGRGSEFRIYLPWARGPGPRAAAVTEPPAGSETILVVEDEFVVRQLAIKMLQAAGYRVLDAASAVQALAIAESGDERIDLVLSDIGMPGMTGRDLATRFAVDHPDMKFLFMSGYVDEERVGVLAEKSCFLAKPFTVESLREAVRKALDGGSGS